MSRPYHSNNSARIIPLDNPARYDDAVLMSKITTLLAEAQARLHLSLELVSLLGETIHECKIVEMRGTPGFFDLAPSDKGAV